MTEKQPTCSKISSSEFLLSELPDDSPSSSSAETVNSKEQIVENQQQQKMEGEDIDLYQFEQEALNKINSIKCEVEHLKEEILIFDKDTLKSLFGRYEELLILKTLDLDDIETRGVDKLKENRRATVLFIQDCLKLLDSKINDPA
ncbi:uncharacterized protein LOC143204682 [Rhynchophorus ferrugineus]|uniref:uncharacterized protein LOC143204682 n=1 Tax=Rhynchophorus ferrugineus TaxID=354439 RepID=UPI003FCEE24E